MSKTIGDYINEIARLKAELAFKDAILNRTPCMIFVNEAWRDKNELYCIANIYANEWSLKNTGYDRAKLDMMGGDFGRNTFHPHDYELSEISFNYLCDPKNIDEEFGGLVRYKDKDGKYHWGLNYATKMPPVDGQERCRFTNFLIPMDKHMHLAKQIHLFIAESRRIANDAIIKKISPAEKRVLIEVAKGLSNQKIANKLFVTVSTVKSHKQNLMRKFGLKNAPALTAFAYEIGIV